jgi:tetratricopeptide (TPR) repeat protein
MSRLIHPKPFIICPPDDFVQKNLDLRDMSRRLAEKYANTQVETNNGDDLQVVVTDDDLQIMGNMLWKMLDTQNDFDAAYSEVGEAILPVIIKSGAADVQALPWETLFHPMHEFIGKNPAFTLTRQLSARREAARPLDKGPLRVLLFTSLPDDVNPETRRLNIEEEQSRVQEALLQWTTKGLVDLEMPDDGRFSTLKELLKSFQPHILFLSGHGRFHHAPHANEAYGEFFFESEAGDSETIKEDDIANALIGMGVQAVILSACESGKAASDALSNGLMRRISAQGIPHVIGMRESISDTAGIDFARTLCNELAKQEYIDSALQCARKDISTTDERGQWCLPVLISSNPHAPLIDWDFQPKKMDGVRLFKDTLGDVSLPKRFVGRRTELRRYKDNLLKGKIKKLLISGPGGQGKTSLAGKLALDLQKCGWQVFAWSAKLEKSFRDFELEMEQTLEKSRADQYNKFLPHAENEIEHAKFMFNLLMEQFNGHVIIFLDNLESIQNPDTRMLEDSLVAAWVEATNVTQGLILLATSRWQIPNWRGEYLRLAHTNYGDFLQIVQGLHMPASILEKRGELRRVYNTLGGNSRGLEFFAAAVKNIQSLDEEYILLETLAKTKADLQTNMAIAAIYKHLPAAAQKLLWRLPVYYEPVPLEGFIVLGDDIPNSRDLVQWLLDVSLLEASNVQHQNLVQYQCNPLVRDWLDEQNLIDNSLIWLSIAAEYYFSLFLKERRALPRAIATYHALRRAQYHDKADFLALNDIIGPLTRAGYYKVLLDKWLPPICYSQDDKVRGKALAHTGLLLKNMGDFEGALRHLDRALTIQQKIPDKAGEAMTLNYMASTYQRRGEYEKALMYLEQALKIWRRIQNKKGEVVILSNIAQIEQGQGDYKTALKRLEEALEIQKQTSDQNQGATLNNISQILKAQGDYSAALEYLRLALVIQQRIGDKPGESITFNNISGIYQRRNNYETALKYLKQALAIQRQIGDKPGEGMTLNNISGLYRRQGEFHTALEYLDQAWDIQKKIGDKAGQGMTLNNIASVYQARGEYEIALSNYRQALDIGLALRDQAGEAQTLNNIGTVLQAQGDYETALKNFEQALIIVQANSSKAGEGTTLNNIGSVLHAQGKHHEALQKFEHALNLTRQIGDQIGEGATLNNMGAVHEAQRNDQAALVTYNQALAIRRKIGDQEGEAQSLTNLSKTYRKQGENETALKYLELAGAIQEQIGARTGLCITFLNQGHVHMQNGNTNEAVDAWSNAYLLAREMNLVFVLQELAKLAPTVELREGLDDWEILAKKEIPGREKCIERSSLIRRIISRHVR